MSRTHPFIRVVVIAFDGAEMTMDCLRSITRSSWPSSRIEIVLVDNGSLDGVVALVRNELPHIRLLEPMRNLGFAGGCNLGIESTSCSSGNPLAPFDCVALVNNDATVEADWLEKLIEPFEESKDIGAVSPKMLFAPRYSEIEMSGILSDGAMTGEGLLRVRSIRLNGVRADDALAFDECFSPLGDHADREDELDQATRRGGRLRIVRDPGTTLSPMQVSICVGSNVSGRLRLRSDVDDREVHLSPMKGEQDRHWVDVQVGSDVFDVINNVGSELYIGGSAGDRGFLQRDRGQYDEPAEVFAWCGGAVLLRKEYLDDVGLFDESFFLYYEDTDLSWRGQLRGWRYMYEPSAVIRHRHAQSSVAGSDLLRFQVDRNRLLVLTKNAPWLAAISAVVGELRRFGRLGTQDIVKPMLRLSPPRLRELRLRWRILRSYFSMLPGVLRDRWSMKLRRSRAQIFLWAVQKIVSAPNFEAPPTNSQNEHLQETTVPLNSPAQVESRSVRPRAAVFNLYWDTLGGGEVVSGEIARLLTTSHEVTLLGPKRPDPQMFLDRLGIDISQCDWREIHDDAGAGDASAEYDVFVNGTYSSRAVNRAPVGLYYVHFPRVLLPQTTKLALETGIRLSRLASRTPFRTSKFATAERLFQERLGNDSWVSSYTKFLANSRYTQKWVERIWHCGSQVIHPPVRGRRAPDEDGGAVDGHSPMSAKSPVPKSCVIASVGRFFDPNLGHSKKQLEMLTAFADMARSREGVDDWRLVLVGGADGASRDYVLRIRRAAQDLPIDVHVNAGRDVVDESLSEASIYWHASGYDEDEQRHPERFEHFGISVVEAMAAGAVPLVFGAAGPAEIVRDGIDGFHWHTLEQLARVTRRLMHDDELLQRMSQSARVRARDFAPEVFDEHIRALVESLSAANHSAPNQTM